MNRLRLQSGFASLLSILLVVIVCGAIIGGILFVRASNSQDSEESAEKMVLVEAKAAQSDIRAINGRRTLAAYLEVPESEIKIIKISQDAPVSYDCGVPAGGSCDVPIAVTLEYKGSTYYAVVRSEGHYDIWDSSGEILNYEPFNG